ncbi:MAG TPA: hypothetical protein VGC63_04820 [Solirubrobacterales bacterium]
MINGLSPILLLGIGAGAFALIHFVRNWREWLRLPESPPVQIAGDDDQDIDFDAALKSLDRDRPHREYRAWEGIPR